jgi:MoxR-like ATPase
MTILNFIADGQVKTKLDPILTIDDVNRMRDVVRYVNLKDSLKQYIVKLVMASRKPETVDSELANLVRFGCSPRATINLTLASRAHAFQRGRTYVVPEDIKTVAPHIMGHRILVTYEAEAEDVDSYKIVDRLLEAVEVP